MVSPAMQLPKALSKAIEIVLCLGAGLALIIGSVYAIDNGVAIVGSGPDAALGSCIVWLPLALVGAILIRLPFDF